MFDINLEVDISTLLVQANTEQVMSDSNQSKPTWIDGRDRTLRTFENYMQEGAERLRGDLYEYEPVGKLGIPTLKIYAPIEYITGPSSEENIVIHPRLIGLASQACLFLDLEAEQAGAWGPECKITKFTTLPEGKLEKWDDPRASDGDYFYKPPYIGTDLARYILENGEGKQVDVIITFNITDDYGHLHNDLSPEQPNEKKQSSTTLEAPEFHILFDGRLDKIRLDFSDSKNNSFVSAPNHNFTPDDNSNG